MASRPGYALVAEFDRQNASLYRQVIEELGLEVVLARDGNAGKGVLQSRGGPALLVTDPSLPSCDGLSLVMDCRRRFPPQQTAVVIFSAFRELRMMASNFEVSLGISEIADKNLSPATVRDVFTRALASRSRLEHGADEELSPEDLSHDFLRGVVRMFRVPIALLSIDVLGHRSFTAYATIEDAQAPVSDQAWEGVCREVITNKRPLVVPDVAMLGGASSCDSLLRVRSFVAVPLVASCDLAIGVLVLQDVKPLTLSPEQIDALMHLQRPIADELARRYLPEPQADLPTERTEEHWAALQQLALTDSLTGLYNRRAGEMALTREAARNRRSGSGLSLVLLDLDNFKEVNDSHGHEIGDRALSDIGRILKASFRASDMAIRWGGDEFLVLLPDVNLQGAAVWAERARAQVERLSFFVGSIGRITLSAGIAEVGRQEDPLAALKRADANLYEAKAEGGNRVGRGFAQLENRSSDPASL